MSDKAVCVNPDALQRFVTDALMSQNVPVTDATTVAGLMTQADLLGYSTHGIFRLRQYMARLRDGGCNAMAKVCIVRESAATALVDGDNGLGHLAMDAARKIAIEKARTAGVAWVGVRRGNHAGPLALYVRPQTEAGMIGMASAVGSANHVPPYGSSDILLGTNPIAIAAPVAGSDPFVLDMATTVAAMGKIKTLAQQGLSMPEGWMLAKDGTPLTDPGKRSDGFMLPIGGNKGFGLSVAIGLMAGVLNGAAFGSSVVDFTKDTTSETNTGQFVLALDIAMFGELDAFQSDAASVFQEITEAEPLPGHPPVRLPGQGKAALSTKHAVDGIPINDALFEDLQRLADEYHLPELGHSSSTRQTR